MRNKRKIEIRNMANELLLKANISEPPIDVEKIAKILNVEIVPHNFEDHDAVSGILIRNNNETIIGVNSHHPKERQRFTIAHEIGHLQLHSHKGSHMDRNSPSLIRLRDDVSSLAVDEDEIESNTFAAELLMPSFLIQQEFRKITSTERFNEDIVDKLAEDYEVSVQAMTYRLMNLGLIVS